MIYVYNDELNSKWGIIDISGSQLLISYVTDNIIGIDIDELTTTEQQNFMNEWNNALQKNLQFPANVSGIITLFSITDYMDDC